jgi:hypothetical protein
MNRFFKILASFTTHTITHTLLYFLTLNTITSQVLPWPIAQTNDPASWDKISCTFGEIHGSTNPHFHLGIDIDNDAINCRFRSIVDGTIVNVTIYDYGNINNFMVVRRNNPLPNGLYLFIVYRHINTTKLPGMPVAVNDTIGTIRNSTATNGDHLHLEFAVGPYGFNINNCTLYNPLRNPLGLRVEPATADATNPEVNKVIIQPSPITAINCPGDFRFITNGTGIQTFQTSNLTFNTARMPGDNTTPLYNYGTGKVSVFGSVAPIANARDRNVNSLLSTAGVPHKSGTGLTLYKIRYKIGTQYLYHTEFDAIPRAEQNQHGSVFHTAFNNGTNILYGNNDFIQLRTTNNNFVSVEKMLNGRRGTGLWVTRLRTGQNPVVIPTEVNSLQLSRHNAEAVFKDGSHDLTVEVEDAANFHNNAKVEIIVDNFPPYVETVKALETPPGILAGLGMTTTRYERKAEYNTAGQLSTTIYTDEGVDVNCHELKVEIKFSEAVQNVVVTNDQNIPFSMANLSASADKTTWTYRFSGNEIQQVQANVVNLTITAKDLANNNLMNLEQTTGFPNSINIPTRISRTAWSSAVQGNNDGLHYFKLNPCTRNNLNDPNVELISQNVTVNDIQNASNPQACDGAIDLEPGQNGPYTYSWSNGETTEDINNLCPGTYEVTVTNGQGCERVLTIPVQACGLSPSYTFTPASDHQTPDGGVNLEVQTLATSNNFTYSWSGPSGTFATQDLSNVKPGAYQLTIHYGMGCTFTDVVIIPHNGQCRRAISATATVRPACDASVGTGGSISLSISGGYPPFQVTWSNGSANTVLTNLAPGNYCVSVTDQSGCVWQNCYQVYPIITANATTSPSCNGGNTGSIQLQVSAGSWGNGGTSFTPYPMNYLWSNGQTTASIQNLSAGSYCVTITALDSRGTSPICRITRCYRVEHDEITLQQGSMSNSCNGNGSINPVVNSNSAVSYLWSNGATTPDIAGLSQGTYCLTATNANGCSATQCFTVNSTMSITGTSEASCSSQNSGSIDISVNGFNGAGYTFQWSSGATVADPIQLGPGNYCVTVTDQGLSGCTATACFDVQAQAPMTAQVVNIQPSCTAEPNGSAEVILNGGNPGFNYFWSSGGQNSPSPDNLSSGLGYVIVIDNSMCFVSVTFNVPAYSVQLAGNASSDACAHNPDGQINLSASGGFPPYNYQWANSNSTSSSRANLAPGTYNVTMTDSRGCPANRSFTIATAPVTRVYDQNNCQYSTTSCHNMVVSTDFVPCQWVNEGGLCRRTCYCENGDHFSQDHGMPSFFYYAGGMQGGSAYCNQYQDCVFDNGYRYVMHVNSYPITTTYIGYFSGCAGSAPANVYYCNGQYVGHTCMGFARIVELDSMQFEDPFEQVTQAEEEPQSEQLKLYPNPAENTVHLEYTSETDQHCKILLRDLTGKLIFYIPLDMQAGITITPLDLSELSAGIYYVQVVDQKGNSSIRKLYKL